MLFSDIISYIVTLAQHADVYFHYNGTEKSKRRARSRTKLSAQRRVRA